MTKGTLVAPQPEAAEIGGQILQKGGNAIDAAIAMAFTQTVVDPQMCGIAGFGSAQILIPEKKVHTTIDFHGRAPLSTTEDMWLDSIQHEATDGWGFILKNRENEFGYQSIGTPRTLAALETMLKNYGTMSLDQLIAPSLGYCFDGFLIRPHISEFWNLPPTAGRDANLSMITKFSSTRKIYCDGNGMPLKVGDTLINKDMGSTLEKISKHGVREFYQGEISHRIIEDISAKGGLLTYKDLTMCQPEGNAPLRATFKEFDIFTNHPPGGGIMLLQMLKILENFDLKKLEHNSPEYIRVVSEAMKLATIDKDNKVGDPRFVDVPLNTLLSKEYCSNLSDQIRDGRKADVSRFNNGGQESKNTTQICAVDQDLNCVTITHTLGQPSGVVTDGLGFMYNGAMTVFDPRPGRPGSLAPGKARFSAISPTIVKKDDKPILILGSPGATYITMGNLQVILNVLEFGMEIQEAISAPRFAATSNTIEISNRILRSTETELKNMGYPILRDPKSFTFAWVHGILISDGLVTGGADPATDGMSLSI